ncbi:MAG: xylosidase/arabinosidase [Phycisphaerales bacterium]|nr:xylosidase/arabinosidase [Phycisphaerales bacterium]
MRLAAAALSLLLLSPAAASAQPEGAPGPAANPATPDWILRPYDGPTPAERPVTTLHGTVMVGYQGWFMAPGDGYGAGFVHWGNVGAKPPSCTVDLWPDLTDYGPDERYPTEYRHADGSAAEVFSSTNRATVLRHFRWMRDYGIDGAFVQRFTACISPDHPERWNDRRTNAVLQHCREGANVYGRAYAVMYDTDFDGPACDTIIADWTRLRRDMHLLETNAYMRHSGGPVVALWGFGFNHRRFDAPAAGRLLAFLKSPDNGGCTIMLGVPNDWASWTDERMELIQRYAAIVSPWNVGRYNSDASADAHFARLWPGDLALCKRLGIDYQPVVFPGFSWTNLKRGASPLDQIPRRKGEFFWHQVERVHDYGMDMAYIAMFDEVDEGTAIFKITNDPPAGDFVTLEGLPSDHYLQLARQAGRLLRGEPVALPAPLGEQPESPAEHGP